MAASYLDEARLRKSIAAVATAVGAGAIGIVRISGSDAIELGARVFSNPTAITGSESHKIHLGSIQSGSDQPIDRVLALVMRAPRTYTGEDVVEFHAHGGYVQVERVLRACIEAGALPALPGEFTFRAFMNGKIDLTQAEAVADLIESQTEMAARVAMEHSDGMLRNDLESIRERLASLRARCEANIDFADDDIPDVERPALVHESKMVLQGLERLINSYASGRLLREGARVVLSGVPNVGKSSIFNALLRTDRAIVTEIPGTTRDAVTETLDIKGIPVILADTAGMRDGTDMVEREGVARGKQYREAADLVLEVEVATQNSREMDAGTPNARSKVPVINKIDLISDAELKSLRGRNPDAVLVSAVSGAGLDELCDEIYGRLMHGGWSGEEPVVTRRRHYQGLVACREAVSAFERVIQAEEPLELAAMELRTGLAAIDELVGRVYDEDVLNRIFGEFCIGK